MGNKPSDALIQGMQAAIADAKKKAMDLHPLVKFFLETHPNSTIRQIATGISRTLSEVQSACVALEQGGEIESTFRLKTKRRRKGA